jgi:hypothetical protein
LSQGGLLMTGDGPPTVGSEIEVHIDWPIRLDGVQPLELVGKGRVLRTDERGTAVKLGNLIFSKTPGGFSETRWASLNEPDRTDCCLTVRAVKIE